MSEPNPLPLSMRFVGPAKAKPPLPFGLASFSDDGEAWLVGLTQTSSVALAASELPAPRDLAPGTLVVVLGDVPAKGLFSVLSGARTAPRGLRASALLARGYVDLGACTDPRTKLDLVWGRAP